MLIMALLFISSSCSFMNDDIQAVKGLARRIVPEYSRNIRFEQISDTIDVFEIQTLRNRLVIKGNNANSMAVGLNHYLKNYCGVTVSWHEFDPVQYPDEMPCVDSLVRVEALVKDRFFLNYCTFGYTMAWWKWADWERLIDWMALNGINMPLANTGVEAVWQKVWKKHGMTDEQILAYFTGPAHLPWHRMNNIDHFDGPLPQNWIDSQVELQKKILKRERQLNMRPVLTAFNGHVPEQLKEIYPQAQITDIKAWSKFAPEYLCHFLAPMDTLYSQIQRDFMIEQEKMFGTDHIYGVDLFNEVDAPSWDPQTLAEISRCAYESMASVDPEAIWLQMGWMFYNDRWAWKPEIVKAYLTAVPQGKVMILDYYLDGQPVWDLTESFYGQPYIYCYLGNFGGNTRLAGHFHQTSEKIARAYSEGGDNMVGIGSTLEGFGVNQFMYEFVLDKAWSTGISDDEWVEKLSARRIGKKDSRAEKVWDVLTDSIYIKGSYSSQTPLTCARPCLEGFWHWTAIHNINFDNATLVRALEYLLTVDSDRDTYRFDVVNLGTQALGNHFATLREQFTAAYRAKDYAMAEAVGKVMMSLIEDMDALAACEPQFSLKKWLDDASACAKTEEEAAYYRRNARTILTSWGNECSIRDYSSRNWSGLIKSYYAPRWKMFIEEILSCIEDGREYNQAVFFERITEFENQWAAQEQHIEYNQPSDYKTLTKELLERYGLISGTPLTLVSYNVGTFSKYLQDSTPAVADFIAAAGADIVALNELDSCNRRHNVYQLEVLAEMAGEYDYSFASAFPFAGGSYGNGVMVKGNVCNEYRIALPVFDGSEYRSVAVVVTPDYVVGSTHLDFKGEHASKAQAEMISTWFAERYSSSDKPVFLCGDMNSKPSSETVSELLKCWNLISGTDATYPSEEPKSCIDYIFCLNNKAHVELTGSSVISSLNGLEMAENSDHLPVLVSLRYK